MLNGTFDNVREALASLSDAREQAWEDSGEYADLLATSVQALLDELAQPTNVQALALARLMRDRPGEGARVTRGTFGLPTDYWHVVFVPSNFECGIAPDGSVSS